MIKRAIFILLYLTSDVILETCRDKNRSTFTIAQANRQECMVKKTMKTWRNANKGQLEIGLEKFRIPFTTHLTLNQSNTLEVVHFTI